jgi:hypothetical protein
VKVCSKCKEHRPFEDFYKNKTAKDGLQSYCKPCKKADSKKYREETGYDAKYYLENAERQKERSRQYRLDNPEYHKKYNSEYYSKHSETLKVKSSKWAKENRAKANANKAKYKADKRRATPSWSNPEDISAMYLLAKKINDLTGSNLQVDHIIPLRGKNVCGLHVVENLQLLAAPLNLSKSNKHVW